MQMDLQRRYSKFACCIMVSTCDVVGAICLDKACRAVVVIRVLASSDCPSSRDRMWEAGGPRLSGVNNGKLVVGMEIVGNQSISQHKVLSHMQTRTDRDFDEKQLQADLHELYRRGLFRKIAQRSGMSKAAWSCGSKYWNNPRSLN